MKETRIKMTRKATEKRLVKRRVYFYSFNHDRALRVYKGNVYKDTSTSLYFFKDSNKKSKRPYIVNCSIEEGTYFKSGFWLRELDKSKAIDVYYDYAIKVIEEKTKTIQRLRGTCIRSAVSHMEDCTEDQEWMHKLSQQQKTQS